MAIRADGDAYIAVHADTGPYRRELGPETEAASKAAGKRSGDRFGREFNISLLGRLKGSRNDFANAVGTIGGFIERVSASAVAGGLNAIGNALANLGTRLLQTEGPLSGFGAILGSIAQRIQGVGAGGIDGLIVQILAMGVAFQAVAVLAGTFAAGLSVITAAATSLAVTLGGAILGGLTLLGPIIAGLTVGVTALALAFGNLSDEQKTAFNPLTALFDETRAAVGESLFRDMGAQVDSVTSALTPFRAVLVSVADATREWFTQTLGASAANTELQNSLSTLGTALPGLFTSLLTLISSVGSSLAGLFAAASPAAQSFLDKINGVVAQFSTWVNSAGGQDTINTFLNTALSLLSQVWGIATQLGTTLGILFEEGAASGSTFLRMIENILLEFNTWLNDEGGRDALTQWFADSVVAIREVGAVLESLILLFNELDNEDTRNAFNLILVSLRAIVDAITLVIAINNAFVSNILHGSATAQDSVNRVTAAFGRANSSLSDLLNGAQTTFGRIGDFVAALPGRIASFFGDAGNLLYNAGVNIVNGLRNGIASAAQGVLNYISGLATRIATAFQNALGIRSPSKVFTEFGRNISEGLAIGIADSSGLVSSAMSGLTGNLNTPISSLGGAGQVTSSSRGGLTLNEGAIVVNSPFANGRLVALSVMDALAVAGK